MNKTFEELKIGDYLYMTNKAGRGISLKKEKITAIQHFTKDAVHITTESGKKASLPIDESVDGWSQEGFSTNFDEIKEYALDIAEECLELAEKRLKSAKKSMESYKKGIEKIKKMEAF